MEIVVGYGICGRQQQDICTWYSGSGTFRKVAVAGLNRHACNRLAAYCTGQYNTQLPVVTDKTGAKSSCSCEQFKRATAMTHPVWCWGRHLEQTNHSAHAAAAATAGMVSVDACWHCSHKSISLVRCHCACLHAAACASIETRLGTVLLCALITLLHQGNQSFCS